MRLKHLGAIYVMCQEIYKVIVPMLELILPRKKIPIKNKEIEFSEGIEFGYKH